MNYIEHHGILGMHWGVRRYQNKDGSLTEAGRKRYEHLNEDDKNTAKINYKKALRTASVVGGVVLAGTAVYLGRQYVANNIDTVIKKGTKIQTIMNIDNIEAGRHFYATNNKLDKIRYGAINYQQGGHSNVFSLTTNKEFKIASNKSAAKVFDNLMKNDHDFADKVGDKMLEIHNINQIYLDPFHHKAVNKMGKEFVKDKYTKNVYDIFNVELANGGLSSTEKTKFYDALKKAGYAGVKDVNDVKYTNYRSINPFIMIDGKDKFGKITVKEISPAHYKAGFAIVTSQGMAKTLSLPITAISGYKISNKIYKSVNDPKIVSDYREQHPNSKLTYNEILKMLKEK